MRQFHPFLEIVLSSFSVNRYQQTTSWGPDPASKLGMAFTVLNHWGKAKRRLFHKTWQLYESPISVRTHKCCWQDSQCILENIVYSCFLLRQQNRVVTMEPVWCAEPEKYPVSSLHREEVQIPDTEGWSPGSSTEPAWAGSPLTRKHSTWPGMVYSVKRAEAILKENRVPTTKQAILTWPLPSAY